MLGSSGKTVASCAMLILSGVLAAPAHAQRVVCSQAMRASTCDLLAVPMEKELKLLNAPTDWTWVILDGRDWREASRRFKTEGLTNKAFTVLELRTTFFRGEFLEQHRPRPTIEILAHEMAHIQCTCKNEKKAEGLAAQLVAFAFERQRTQPHPSGLCTATPCPIQQESLATSCAMRQPSGRACR